MYKNKKQYLLKTVFLAGAILGSTTAFAHNDKHNHDEKDNAGVVEPCSYPTLVTNIIDPVAFGTTNTTVCVDVPVALKKTKVVFNLDTASVDGAGRPIGLRHMWMLGKALQARIQAGLIDPEDISIIGVLHGTAAAWALKSTPHAGWINNLFNLKNEGVNIQLEICGVTMNGHHWTKKDLYSYTAEGEIDSSFNSRIYVNQGAIGRLIDLQQHKYAYIHEGYEDHD